MGWTSYHAKYYYKNGKINRKAECDSLFTKPPLKSIVVGSTYYAAVKEETDENPEAIICIVILTHERSKEHFNFFYKAMDESWIGDVKTDCPISILDMLTPTSNEHANEWREKCRKYHADKKENNLSALSVGTVLKLEDGTLVKKMAPNHQFKRNWYWKCGTKNYIPVTRIKKYKVIVKV